jgi:hypothetical protein
MCGKTNFRRILALLAIAVIALVCVQPAAAAPAIQDEPPNTIPIPINFGELSVNGLSFMVLVVGIVRSAKTLGLAGRGLTVLAMMLGTGLAIGYQVGMLYPQFKVWFDIVVFGLGGGVAGTGYYDMFKERWPNINIG